MEKYRWEYRDEVYNLNHIFEITIGESSYRFKDEGILEIVNIYLNGKSVLTTGFGRHHQLNILKCGIYTSSTNSIDDFYFNTSEKFAKILDVTSHIEVQIQDDDFDNFHKWIIESLTPIDQKRKEKINQIKKCISNKK